MLTLNSIMFLLIPEGHLNCFNWKAHFKFHYVSINLESLNQYGERKQNFKFHYVSINSEEFITAQKG